MNKTKNEIEKKKGCVYSGLIWRESITSLISCCVLRPRPYQAPVTVMAIDEIVRMVVRICFRVAI